MIVNELVTKVQDFISQNKLKEGVEELLDNLRNSEYYNEILIQSGKLKQLNKDKRLGILSADEINRNESRIQFSILELLEVIKNDRRLIPVIRENQKWGKDIDLRIDITVDLFEITHEETLKYYKTMDFADANDFLNQIYFRNFEFCFTRDLRKGLGINRCRNPRRTNL